MNYEERLKEIFDTLTGYSENKHRKEIHFYLDDVTLSAIQLSKLAKLLSNKEEITIDTEVDYYLDYDNERHASALITFTISNVKF